MNLGASGSGRFRAAPLIVHTTARQAPFDGVNVIGSAKPG